MAFVFLVSWRVVVGERGGGGEEGETDVRIEGVGIFF